MDDSLEGLSLEDLSNGGYELYFIEETAERIPFTGATQTPGDTTAQKPAKAHGEEDAGFDLRAVIAGRIFPGRRQMVPIGIRAAIPQGYAGLVLPRSGLAHKYGITVLNSPGLIDPGYRGDWNVILWHTASVPGSHNDPFSWNKGDRIAQLVIVKTPLVQFEQVTTEQFESIGSKRDTGGFGSTDEATKLADRATGNIMPPPHVPIPRRDREWDNHFGRTHTPDPLD